MLYTMEEIKNKYLAGGQLGYSADEIVTAFNLAERFLGQQWIDRTFQVGGTTLRGASSTLEVVRIGSHLEALKGANNASELLKKIIRGDRHSLSELTGLHLITGVRSDVQREIYPSTRNGVPDLRIQMGDSPWTYVEVTMQDHSEEQQRLQVLMQDLIKRVEQYTGTFSLELLLTREPDAPEVQDIYKRLPPFCALTPPQKTDLPNDLGILRLHTLTEHIVEIRDEDNVIGPTGLFVCNAVREGARTVRKVTTQVRFSDQRAEQVLRKESRQLPKDVPGVIMIDLSRTPASIKEWEKLLSLRMQPKQHTRVSAVYMWKAYGETNRKGLYLNINSSLLTNPHAFHPLPAWIQETLEATTGLP